MKSKTCSRCKTEKLIEEFSNSTHGLFGKKSHCKRCMAEKAKIKYDAGEKVERLSKKEIYRSKDSKVCRTCGADKLKSMFYDAPTNSDRKKNSCIECELAYRREHYGASK